MHIQPQYIPIADLRFAPPAHIERIPVQETQVIMATVLSRSDGGLVRLLINDLQVDVQLPLLVQRGQQIPLKLTEANGQQVLEIPVEFVESHTPISASLRQSLPKQEVMQEALPKLFQILSQEDAPPHLQKAITQLQEQLPKVETFFNGAGIKNALLNSGLFLERKLLHADSSSPQKSQQNASDNHNGQTPSSTEAFRQDVKANLWRLLQHLTGLVPQDSKPKAEIFKNNQAPITDRNAPPSTKEGPPQHQQGGMQGKQPENLADLLKAFSLSRAKLVSLKAAAPEEQNARSMISNLNNGIAIPRNLASISQDKPVTGNPEQNTQPVADELSQSLQPLPQRTLTPSTSPENHLSKALLAFIETANLAAGKAQPQQPRMDNPNHNENVPIKNQVTPEQSSQTSFLKTTADVNTRQSALVDRPNPSLPRNTDLQSLNLASSTPKSMTSGQNDASALAAARQADSLNPSSQRTTELQNLNLASSTPKPVTSGQNDASALAAARQADSLNPSLQQRNVDLQNLNLASSTPKPTAGGQNDASALTTARQLVEAALGRIELTQLASLPREGAQHIFTEIVANYPFLWVIPLQIRIDQDIKKQTGETPAPHWSVALTLDLGDLGRMDALLWQEKTAVSASLWTEKAETRTLLRDRLPLLQSFLQEAGIAVGNLSLHEGSAPIRADEPHVDANNLVNLFL